MIKTGHNSTFAMGGGFPKQIRDKLCCADILVQGASSVLLYNFSAKLTAIWQDLERRV